MFLNDLIYAHFFKVWSFAHLANPIVQVSVNHHIWLTCTYSVAKLDLISKGQSALRSQVTSGLKSGLSATHLLWDFREPIAVLKFRIFILLWNFIEGNERVDLLCSCLATNVLLDDIFDFLRLHFGLIVRVHLAFFLIDFKHFKCLHNFLLVEVDLVADST